MKNSTLVPFAFVCMLGCSDSAAPQDVNVAGRWNIQFLTAGASAGYSCTGEVSLDLTQSGSSIGGSYANDVICTTPHDRRDDNATGVITDASLTNSALSFRTGSCRFTGTLESDTRMAGGVNCGMQAEIPVTFTGTWSASR